MRNKLVAIGLGSNLGLPIDNLRRALAEIKKNRLFKVLNVASIYESDALLPDRSTSDWNKKYINSAVLCEINADFEATQILQTLKTIESNMGRADSERWSPRVIDLDILYWSDTDYKSDRLQIPHKELFNRPFALLPLIEIWPDKLNHLLPDWSGQGVTSRPLNTKRSNHFFWPKMVGILNITGDSFSDGGLYLDENALHEQYEKLLGQGVDIIDVGAESTRPGAKKVDQETEFENLSYALRVIGDKVPISLDCRNYSVVEKICERFKIEYLNDVCGLENKEIRNLVKKYNLNAFVMHSLTVPPTEKDVLSDSENLFYYLTSWWDKKNKVFLSEGLDLNKLVFDPGIGFGKTKQQCFSILQNLVEFNGITSDVMIAHSRKSFLTLITDKAAAARDLETALVTAQLNLAYTQYLRVHDVESQIIALRAKK